MRIPLQSNCTRRPERWNWNTAPTSATCCPPSSCACIRHRRKSSHGNPVLQTGKLKVALEQIEPAGQYALKLTFSDGHDSGLYTGLPRTRR